ncbi:hypothetical protein RhiirC2_857881 [Rhizophagus irregularis]|uniref:Uncharacterized protein n=1 Tax=Rhizophagus irregularis TaxID=588596 RepID=A0A2N1M9D3_9GLOM|nr:hypothetical protein RhiirC2_857881 [Rhizophagus irregularis]
MATITELDLVHEQQRRYDAEAERDNEIIRRQLAEGRMANVISDLYQYQTNTQNQGQILALQNNLPNQVNMIGIPHPYFDWDDSIPDFLAQLRLDLQNWQANLVAVNGRTAVQIGANALNEASLLEKQKTEFQMAQQAQIPVSQTVEPIRQLKGPPSSLKSEEGLKNYYVSEYLKKIGLLNKDEFDSDYPVKNFQRSRPQRNNNSARFDRIEEGLEETRNNVNQLADLFQKKAYIQKCGIYPGSEFGGINDPAIKALGWKADKPSNFAIKGNSKHITDSLGWYTDVPVTLKDKENKTVTVIGNFVRIDNGETEPMLFFGMSNIRKLQGVPEPNKNQFRIKLHGKAYIIPTFSKAPVVKDPPKEKQDQASTNSSSPTSEENLKKSA